MYVDDKYKHKIKTILYAYMYCKYMGNIVSYNLIDKMKLESLIKGKISK